MPSPRIVLAAVTLLGSFAAVYAGVMAALVRDWARDDNASHGFIVLPVVAWLIWQRRQALATLPHHPRGAGLAIAVTSLLLLMAGGVGAELFVQRVSMITAVAGIVVFLFGWRHLRILAFPLGFALLMIPPPAILFNYIALPLQLVASRFGAAGLALLDVPVLREGNIIVLSNMTLEVAEACSGIRSLMSLLTFAVLYAYLADRRTWVRGAIALTAIPMAIAANGVRVAGTGVAAFYYGPGVADGFLHAFSGWFVFIAAMVPVVIMGRLLAGLARPVRGEMAAA